MLIRQIPPSFSDGPNMNIPPLIFIWIGTSVPRWVRNALILNAKYHQGDVVVLANKGQEAFFNNINIKFFPIENFYFESFQPKDLQDFDKKFRNGFWLKTFERYAVLLAYMYVFNVEKAFHAEFDNLCMLPKDIHHKLDSIGNGVFVPQDSPKRALGSLIYVNKIECLREIVDFKSIGSSDFKNDMDILGNLVGASPNFFALPTEAHLGDLKMGNINSKIINEKYGGIFDAASLGQYLLGVDPRNIKLPFLVNGFKNENSQINWKSLILHYDFDQEIIMAKYENISYRIFNLHIHSKYFPSNKSIGYIYRFIKLLNKNKKSIVCLNFINSIDLISRYLLINLINIIKKYSKKCIKNL